MVETIYLDLTPDLTPPKTGSGFASVRCYIYQNLCFFWGGSRCRSGPEERFPALVPGEDPEQWKFLEASSKTKIKQILILKLGSRAHFWRSVFRGPECVECLSSRFDFGDFGGMPELACALKTQ